MDPSSKTRADYKFPVITVTILAKNTPSVVTAFELSPHCRAFDFKSDTLVPLY